MSANSESGVPRAREETTVRDVLTSDADLSSVLIEGPAMVGKQAIAVDLLATANRAGGQPIAVTTADTVEQLRTVYREAGGEDTDRLAVVDCLPGDGGTENEWTRSVGSPGDLTGIAMAVSKVFESISEQRRDGARLLIDNVAPSLMYTNIEPMYRFLHALIGRVTESGGAVIATLDTDGIEDSEYRALAGLFDTIVEVRQSDGTTEFRLTGREDGPDGWHQHASGGVDA